MGECSSNEPKEKSNVEENRQSYRIPFFRRQGCLREVAQGFDLDDSGSYEGVQGVVPKGRQGLCRHGSRLAGRVGRYKGARPSALTMAGGHSWFWQGERKIV